MTPTERETRRRAIRRRAMANLLLVLLDVARRTAGRLTVTPAWRDSILLAYRDVHTLVLRPAGFALASRDFSVMLALPPLWPFDRSEAPVPVIVCPDDWAHPNSDGHGLCLSLDGVPPERIAGLVYDQLRLQGRRLDHPVSQTAADYVRTYLADGPADPRPLVPGETVPDVAAPVGDANPPATPGIVDVELGVLDVVVPPVDPPLVLRLARPAGDAIDRARIAYLGAASPQLRACTVTWAEGPALSAAADVDRAVLRAEVRELARVVEALGDPAVARSYLTLGTAEDPTTGSTT